ncbi:hypothetical protein [Nostoc sp.]|uniref:hypothetical protein n=1 Tax=Nostoc sp. TaxID=1180 RepID=UPI002FFACBCB
MTIGIKKATFFGIQPLRDILANTAISTYQNIQTHPKKRALMPDDIIDFNLNLMSEYGA